MKLFGHGGQLLEGVTLAHHEGAALEPVVRGCLVDEGPGLELDVPAAAGNRLDRLRHGVGVREAGSDPDGDKSGSLAAGQSTGVGGGVQGRLRLRVLRLGHVEPDHDDARPVGPELEAPGGVSQRF